MQHIRRISPIFIGNYYYYAQRYKMQQIFTIDHVTCIILHINQKAFRKRYNDVQRPR